VPCYLITRKVDKSFKEIQGERALPHPARWYAWKCVADRPEVGEGVGRRGSRRYIRRRRRRDQIKKPVRTRAKVEKTGEEGCLSPRKEKEGWTSRTSGQKTVTERSHTVLFERKTGDYVKRRPKGEPLFPRRKGENTKRRNALDFG